jgi:hypothetical protein
MSVEGSATNSRAVVLSAASAAGEHDRRKELRRREKASSHERQPTIGAVICGAVAVVLI